MGAELDDADVAEAWRCYLARLRRRNFPWRFIENDSADLFAQAKLELLEVQAKGVEVRAPVPWLIQCAWWRSINLVAQRNRRPLVLSADAFESPRCERPTPEQKTLADDQARRLRAAICFLLPNERRIIELIYFEGYSCRGASRVMGWAKSNGDRWHAKALGRLRAICESERWALDPDDGTWGSERSSDEGRPE